LIIKKNLFSFVLLDSAIVFMAFYMTTLLLLPIEYAIQIPLVSMFMALLVGYHILAHRFRLYKIAWEYAGSDEVLTLIKSVSLSVVIASTFQLLVFQEVSIRILLAIWLVLLLLLGASRFSLRILSEGRVKRDETRGKRVLIIGAGSAGTLVAKQLKQNRDCGLNPIAFIDDDKRKHELEIMAIPVVGGLESLQKTVNDLEIEMIIIAIPSLSKAEVKRIYQKCKETNIKTQMIPMIEDLVTGKISVSEIRDVEVDDLLGRKPVELETKSIESIISNNVVLVTGAGGSIGSEICRQVSAFKPSKIVLLGHGENSIYLIEKELKSTYGTEIEMITEIADIRDRERMFSVIQQHQPGVVFHAAAHKHVPLMEKNPTEAVYNNVFGTKNIAEASSYGEVDTFVLVSTDKAVNPTSVMGATKRIAELIVQDMNQKSSTRFVAVRFGNVLGSRGSVIPLFKEQVAKGGPVTVTHPEMKRYFMTIPEASRLVLQAAALARGGEIFVLDMGEPVKIVDLAKNLIKLSGYSEDEIKIQFTGMRPGEKLFEELLNPNEVHSEQIHPKIYVGKSVAVNLEAIIERIQERLNDQLALRDELLAITNSEDRKPVLA
jgi:FlaA1/EpsC-like NDP-sugar epimerase